ncbi:MAG TPA: response regulator transcription factor [Anaerolineae bacterium]|nr:response regulator transcription factor [Anaerolineae bacterium]
MTIWQQLRTVFGSEARSRNPQLDEELVKSVRELAEREQRSQDEVIVSLLSQAIRERRAAGRNWQRWRLLTPREQQVAALVCLNLTGRQVAAKLFISPETVKTHVRSILRKFDLGSRQELRQVLAGWDFSAWLELGNG